MPIRLHPYTESSAGRGIRTLRRRVLSPLCLPVAPHLHCGPEGDRTPDLLRARQPLSQLSYKPVFGSCGQGGNRTLGLRDANAALSQLSYSPIYLAADWISPESLPM